MDTVDKEQIIYAIVIKESRENQLNIR